MFLVCPICTSERQHPRITITAFIRTFPAVISRRSRFMTVRYRVRTFGSIGGFCE
jgi:hypothetical protein